MSSNNIPLKLLRGYKDNLPVTIEDGMIYYCIDSNELFFDYVNDSIGHRYCLNPIVGETNYGDPVGKGLVSPEDKEIIDTAIRFVEQNLELEQQKQARLNINAVGEKTLEGGEIFNDYENNKATQYAHAEGQMNAAIGSYSHAEGKNTQTIGKGSHAEGSMGVAFGNYSHVEGNGIGFPIELIGNGPTYTVNNIFVSGDEFIEEVNPFSYFNIKEGSILKYIDENTYDIKYCLIDYIDLENNQITLTTYGEYQGFNKETNIPFESIYNDYEYDFNIPSNSPVVYLVSIAGEHSHSEGVTTQALGEGSHAEGINTLTLGLGSHAEGQMTTATGNYSHAEGYNTKAIGHHSHAEGKNTIAFGESQHVQGVYNIKDEEEQYLHIVGNGWDDYSRFNAHTLDWEGNAWFAGDVYVKGLGQDDTENVHKLSYDSIEQQNANSPYKNIKFWVGTQEELNTIEDRQDDCLYFTTGEGGDEESDNPAYEKVENKTNIIDENSTNNQYPSAKAVHNAISNISAYEKVENKTNMINEYSTDEQYPSAKAVHTAISNINLPYSYGTEDLVAGESPLAEGQLYFVYE